MASGLFLVVLLASVGAVLALYVLIRAETAATTVTDRAAAEREAREFGGRDGSTSEA